MNSINLQRRKEQKPDDKRKSKRIGSLTLLKTKEPPEGWSCERMFELYIYNLSPVSRRGRNLPWDLELLKGKKVKR